MTDEDVITGVELTDDEYTVHQSLVRNKYRVEDPDGNVVLRAKQKLFKMKEEFPFVDGDDDPVFTVKASGILDIAGDYAIVDEATGETVLVLGKQFTFFAHEWTIERPDGEVLAEVSSRSALLEAARSLIDLLSFLPHKYDITTPDGRSVGGIEGAFAIRDRYSIHVDDPGEVPREAIVAGAVAIDALEGN